MKNILKKIFILEFILLLIFLIPIIYIPDYTSKKTRIDNLMNRILRVEKILKSENLFQKKILLLRDRKLIEQMNEIFIIDTSKNKIYNLNKKDKNIDLSNSIMRLQKKALSSKSGYSYRFSKDKKGNEFLEFVKKISPEKFIYLKTFEPNFPFKTVRWYYLLFFALFAALSLSGISYIIHAGINSLSEDNQMQEKEFNERIREWQLLSAGVAHEIKNPLSSLSMFSELISRKAGKDEQIKEYLSYIFKEIGRLNSIISNFLSFSRPPEININKYDISSIISEVINQFSSSRSYIKFKKKENLSPFYFDSSKIKQVLINIIKNSIEACENKKDCNIDISLSLSGKFVEIDISDNGSGLSEKNDRVLQPFYTTKAQGSGLGLSISYQIIRSHGGTLSLSSNSNGGCTVKITLPYKRIT